MAADLATTPPSSMMVQLCGDAHLSNFGGFASPERELLFDVNDFDETLAGPFEWDLKRLAASLEVAARGRAFDSRTARNITLAGIGAYQQAIREFAGLSNLDVWYARLDVNGVIQRWGGGADAKRVKEFQHNVAKASSKGQIKARAKLTRTDTDGLHFVSDPPLLVPVAELYQRGRCPSDRRVDPRDNPQLPTNPARGPSPPPGVLPVRRPGPQSSRCGKRRHPRPWVALFVGTDNADTLILQVKEAEASVLERFAGHSAYHNQGQHVVEGQRLMQAASDIFLGWHQR